MKQNNKTKQMKQSKTTKQRNKQRNKTTKRLTGLAREDRIVKQKCFVFFRNLANKSYNAPKGPNVCKEGLQD